MLPASLSLPYPALFRQQSQCQLIKIKLQGIVKLHLCLQAGEGAPLLPIHHNTGSQSAGRYQKGRSGHFILLPSTCPGMRAADRGGLVVLYCCDTASGPHCSPQLSPATSALLLCAAAGDLASTLELLVTHSHKGT